MNLPIDPNAYDLIILDADGTIVPNDSDALFDDVSPVLRAIAQANPQIKWVVGSNQGGVGCRYWMEQDDWGDPDKMPTEEAVWVRFQKLQAALEGIAHAPIGVFLCFAYQSPRTGKWGPSPAGQWGNTPWDHLWRKPAPGMIYAAQKWAEGQFGHTKMLRRERILLVGDSAEDEGAAKAAQCRFMSAAEFFGRGMVVVHAYDLPLAGRTIKFGPALYKQPDLSGCVHYWYADSIDIPFAGDSYEGVRFVNGKWSGPQPGEKFWVYCPDNGSDDETWMMGECL